MSPSIEKEWYYGDINHSGNLTMEFFFFLIGNKSIIKKTIKLRSDDTIGCQG